jgi:putative Holliday junction resolvase
MKLLGIDYGRRRIGIAVTDSEGMQIRGLTTIDRLKHPDALVPLLNIINQEAPGGLVMGVPLGGEQNETVMSLEIRAFGDRLQARCPLPLSYVDESYTSQQAQDLLLFRKRKERRNKQNVDRLAACLILDIYQKEQQCGH